MWDNKYTKIFSVMQIIMTRDYCGAYTYRNGSIERIFMGNGFMQDSAYYVQVKDYQGNVRAVLDQNHNVVERNDYYPYGGLINASDTQLQPYKYSSKELDRENGLDLYDSQARWYDSMLPGTTTQDPLAEKYFSISPYTWCAGNPVRFVDDDGKLIIFVNGKIGFGSPPAGEQYWNGRNSSFVMGAREYYDDDNVMFTQKDYSLISSATERMYEGYKYAQDNYELITNKLHKGEFVKFVTHSMGASFAEGMSLFFINNGVEVAEIVHINPYQANDITTFDYKDNETRILTVDYQNTDDKVINNIPLFSSPGDIKNADYKVRELSNDNNNLTRHRSPIDRQGKYFWELLNSKTSN